MMRYEHYLDRAVRRWADRQAVTCDGRSVTFAQLHAQARTLVSGLHTLGVQAGDRVADLRENSVENIVTDFGCAMAGTPRISLNPRLSDEEIAHLLRDAAPRVVLADPAHADRIRSGPLRDVAPAVVDDLRFGGHTVEKVPAPAADETDVLAIRYTGGTTGRSKGALRTHAHQAWVAASMLLDLCDITAADSLLHTQPLSHGAHAFVLPCVMRGARQVILSRFDPHALLRLVEAERITVLKVVPTMLFRILDAMESSTSDLSSLRQVIYGASAMPESLLRRALDAFGPILSQTYGQTEAPATISVLTVDDHRRALDGDDGLLRSAGKPYSTVDVRIVGQDGADLPPRAAGEVAVRGPMTMSAYWGGEHDTPLDEEGFVRTGDIGYLDEEQYLFLVGRSRDMIISGGYNVHPREVEQVLHQLPDVAEAVVVGLPDVEWGDKVVAAVVPAGDLDVEGLLDHCRGRLSSYKVPREVRVVDALPKSAAGKYTRRDVIALLEQSP